MKATPILQRSNHVFQEYHFGAWCYRECLRSTYLLWESGQFIVAVNPLMYSGVIDDNPCNGAGRPGYSSGRRVCTRRVRGWVESTVSVHA